jgi:hypothetical protein
MHASGRNPRAAIAEFYASKAARAAQQGDHRRASELYRAAFRSLEGEERDVDPADFAFYPSAEEGPSGIRVRGTSAPEGENATPREADTPRGELPPEDDAK